MYLSSLHIQGLRSIQDETIHFERGLTTLVGENNTGKSNVALAIDKLFRQATNGSDLIGREDYPYRVVGPLAIEATLQLTLDEVRDWFIAKLLPDHMYGTLGESFLAQQGDEVKMFLIRPRSSKASYMNWGGFYLEGNRISANPVDLDVVGPDFFIELRKAISNVTTPTQSQIKKRLSGQYTLGIDFPSYFGQLLQNKFKLIKEFRLRDKTESRTGAIESMEGSETASVLLNLKNHADPLIKARYQKITNAFNTLFSHYEVDAVEKQSGSGVPDIQFYEGGQAQPLSLRHVSAGVCEILTLLTNLVAREGLIVFLEHPEMHIHPHIMRWLRSFLVESATRNQIIVVTHDPHFVDPRAVEGLRRFWWVPGQGTKICEPTPAPSANAKRRMQTALRYLSDREAVFARSVLLVEDESVREFILPVAEKLGYDLNAAGVSVIFTGGHGGHRNYHALLDSMGIPHVNFRDKDWGHNTKFPPDRFFSLGTEFEQYIDAQGLNNIRAKVVKRVKGTKRQQAGPLGERLQRSQIPEIFERVLKAVTGLATGKPQFQENSLAKRKGTRVATSQCAPTRIGQP